MSFTPSAKFSERWLSSPSAMKEAIHGELDDIMRLLGEDSDVVGFRFQNPDLNAVLRNLQSAHLETRREMIRLAKESRAHELIPKLEMKIDDAISDRMGLLSEELKAWIRQAIKEELDAMEIEL